MTGSNPLEAAHHFEHEAMNTTFSVRLLGGSREGAQGMVRECFEQLDFLEHRLSRYIDGSDVSLINQMQAGETLYLSEPCYECLRLALDAHARTGGLFDITLGRRIEHRKSRQDGPPPPIEGRLTLHPDAPAISCAATGREIDLGGIGKGFALDQLRATLVDWGATDGLIASGASTLLAFGETAWPVDLTCDGGHRRIMLAQRALSASGTEIQGNHIIDPRGESDHPAAAPKRLWAIARTAAMADAMSTALMLMERGEIEAFLEVEDLVEAVFIDTAGTVEQITKRG